MFNFPLCYGNKAVKIKCRLLKSLQYLWDAATYFFSLPQQSSPRRATMWSSWWWCSNPNFQQSSEKQTQSSYGFELLMMSLGWWCAKRDKIRCCSSLLNSNDFHNPSTKKRSLMFSKFRDWNLSLIRKTTVCEIMRMCVLVEGCSVNESV